MIFGAYSGAYEYFCSVRVIKVRLENDVLQPKFKNGNILQVIHKVLKEIIVALTNHVYTCFGASVSSLWSTFGQLIKTIITAMFSHSGYFYMP